MRKARSVRMPADGVRQSVVLGWWLVTYRESLYVYASRNVDMAMVAGWIHGMRYLYMGREIDPPEKLAHFTLTRKVGFVANLEYALLCHIAWNQRTHKVIFCQHFHQVLESLLPHQFLSADSAFKMPSCKLIPSLHSGRMPVSSCYIDEFFSERVVGRKRYPENMFRSGHQNMPTQSTALLGSKPRNSMATFVSQIKINGGLTLVGCEQRN